ncbi:MAG: DUF2207 domain-containing protein [Anderseniella sp.]|nr:DUF2207 domain-containing protein [Anderseniella sp.]
MQTVLKLLAACIASLWLATSAMAEEVIQLFESRLVLSKDGGMEVTETITVLGEGRKIRRGIYRDFPIVFKDGSGRERKVQFDVVSVTRNGQPEDFHIKKANRATRLYIGNAKRLIGQGQFTYQITYRTDRQIRFFDTHDELFWNVTGNFWDFPIQTARAEFVLPDGARAEQVVTYTGRLGSRDNNATASIRNGGNIVTAQTNAPLARREGLSVAIWMPPGSVTRPTSAQEMAWYIRDNLAALISFASFLFIALYYYWAWNRVGRDPQGGPIVPRWDAPDGISPALVHYIHNNGLRGNGAFSAALLSLAVKGHVTLEELGKKDMKIQATGNIPKAGSLPVGEQIIYNKVANRSGGFRIDKANGKSVVSLASGFRSKLASEHRNKYFVRNLPWIIAGVMMSAAAIAISLASAGGDADTIVPLVFGIIVISSLFMVVFNALNRTSGLSGWNFAGIARWAVFGIIAFNFLPAVGSILSSTGTNPLLLTAIGSIVVLNVLFWYLLGAPTPLGQRMMDGIDGLKTYIKLAETDRLNLQGAPAMSPKHYETVLPYAVALGLEKPWSNAFAAWLATAAGAAAAASYSPHWYHGDRFNAGNIGSNLGGVADSISSSMTNAAPAPSSSSSGFSGGGGGGSGGGGGGGGGGGW